MSNTGGYEHDETPTIDSDPNSPICLEPNSTDCTPRAPLDLPLSRKVYIDGSVTLADEHEPKVRSGVVFGQGDGTVSLLSLGSMCVEGWQVSLFPPSYAACRRGGVSERRRKIDLLCENSATNSARSSNADELILVVCSQRKKYNPGGVKVVTHEILHSPMAFDPRGGPTTADHVDILGS